MMDASNVGSNQRNAWHRDSVCSGIIVVGARYKVISVLFTSVGAFRRDNLTQVGYSSDQLVQFQARWSYSVAGSRPVSIPVLACKRVWKNQRVMSSRASFLCLQIQAFLSITSVAEIRPQSAAKKGHKWHQRAAIHCFLKPRPCRALGFGVACCKTRGRRTLGRLCCQRETCLTIYRNVHVIRAGFSRKTAQWLSAWFPNKGMERLVTSGACWRSCRGLLLWRSYSIRGFGHSHCTLGFRREKIRHSTRPFSFLVPANSNFHHVWRRRCCSCHRQWVRHVQSRLRWWRCSQGRVPLHRGATQTSGK